MKFAIPFLALAFVGCASTHQSKLRGNLFSELQPGDRIHIQFESMGCFHHFGYDFHFERSATTTVRISSRSAMAGTIELHSPKPIGTLTLTPRDIAGLDRLVRFYRTHAGGLCTTKNDITIEHFFRIYGPAAPAIATEHYLDLSCATDEIPGVTTLPSLAERLEPKSR